MEKPQTQNRNPNPNPNTREENGKKKEGEEKKKEETPAPLCFPIRKKSRPFIRLGLWSCRLSTGKGKGFTRIPLRPDL